MKNWTGHIRSLLPCLLLGLLSATDCAGEGKRQLYGDAIDPKAPRATLADLIAKPEAFEGKDVVVDGIFAGACGDGDFFFKDKVDIIEADPPKPEVCALKRGTPIRIYGLVNVHRTPAGEAGEKGEGDAKEKAEEESQPGEVYVRIVARSVEILK